MAGHDINDSCKERFKRNEEDFKSVNARAIENSEALVEVIGSSKSAHKRINETNENIEKLEKWVSEVDEQSRSVVMLAKSVEHMATQNQEILTEMKTQRTDITNLQNKPAQDALFYWKMFVGGLIVAAAGILAGAIGTILMTKG